MKYSVLLTTYNRAAVLADTLAAFERLKGDVLGSTEFVVVNNNCTDSTSDVLHDFRTRLPIRVIEESRPGKNVALNTAINSGGLGDIIIFTDDDVVPDPNWLTVIAESCQEHPSVDVFGGTIELLWEGINTPDWCKGGLAQAVVFSRHALPHVGPYPASTLPCGANYWIRRHLLDRGFRFNETLGPRPTRRLMGSESSFLIAIRDAGYPPWHIPHAVVWHRIDEQYLSRRRAIARGFRLGRSRPYLVGPHRESLLKSSLTAWVLLQTVGLVKHVTRYVASFLTLDPSRRFEKQLLAAAAAGDRFECLRTWRKWRSASTASRSTYTWSHTNA